MYPQVSYLYVCSPHSAKINAGRRKRKVCLCSYWAVVHAPKLSLVHIFTHIVPQAIQNITLF